MPARTSAKRTKKSAPAKKSARPAKAARKTMKNGAPKKTLQAAHEAVQAESEKLQTLLLEKDGQILLAQDRIAGLERELLERSAAHEHALHEVQARLTTHQAELEAARSEAAKLREAAAKAREPGRCPRCGGKMSQQLLENVRADRCDACHGIFFDNGELENVMKHHDQQRAAGQKSWLSGIFGKKTT